MTSRDTAKLFIGWDVGGWNCDKNAKSRDALVVLDANRGLVGQPFRGNLRKEINEASDTGEWIQLLLELCAVELEEGRLSHITLAIDTPLGFSLAFRDLITGAGVAGPIESSSSNPYLFRQTEQFLAEHGFQPLSAIKDMIGSQATKGMHVVARFAPRATSVGVWRSECGRLTAIEAYPSPCKQSVLVKRLLREFALSSCEHTVAAEPWELERFPDLFNHEDKRDALVCALIAWLQCCKPEALVPPLANIPVGEGWIFVPTDVIRIGQ